MNKHQAMVKTLRSLLALEDCPNCQGGKKANGKDAQRDRTRTLELVRKAQQAMREYEQELWTQSQLESLERFNCFFLAAADEEPGRRAEYLDTAARIAEAKISLSAPRGVENVRSACVPAGVL